MNKYRSHNCSELNESNNGETVHLSGWLHRKRDHGNLLFIDIRDHFGITQCVIENKNKYFSTLEKIKPESVITVLGKVVKREKGTENIDLKTGKIEVNINSVKILSESNELPMPVFGEQDYPEDIRLKYRFLDLRRSEMHENIILRSKVISFIRAEMSKLGFLEFQTPILTSSSPEGARDFLVPSRLNPGKFYALPQAPQQFKQLIMVSGFDRYFQIAPCFRDEDARADRSPGEFYQLDIEMSFVEQENVFEVVEKLMVNLFKNFSSKKIINEKFPRISYEDSMLNYGSDKPDLRNPLLIYDITNIFIREDVKFDIFKKLVSSGSIVRCIVTKKTNNKPRSFFDNIDKWAKEQGASGLAYFTLEKKDKTSAKGPVGKFFSEDSLKEIMKITSAEEGDSIFFTCGKKKEVERISAMARDKIANDLNIIDENKFAFCWIVDYPMFEIDEETKNISFSHNPFSMPQGDIAKLNFEKPLDIKAFQYDIVCNGIELSSGAIRNHTPELMYKLFSLAGYDKKQVNEKFSGMINALSYGAPPHGGIAPGIDRIVMLLANKKNIREVTLFPLNQNAQDLLMGAPSEVDEKQLKELNIKTVDDKKTNS
jgi:aspartyl-tRNA synthetase